MSNIVGCECSISGSYILLFISWGILSDLFVLLWLSIHSRDFFCIYIQPFYSVSHRYEFMNLFFFALYYVIELFEKSVDFYVRHAIFLYTNYGRLSKQNEFIVWCQFVSAVLEWEVIAIFKLNYNWAYNQAFLQTFPYFWFWQI